MTSLQQYTKFDHTTGRHIRYVRLTIPNDFNHSNPSVKDGVFVESFDQVQDKTLTNGDNYANRARKLDDSYIEQNPIFNEKFQNTPTQKNANSSKRQPVREKYIEEASQYLQCTETTSALLKLEKPAREKSDSSTCPNLNKFISGDGRVGPWKNEEVNGKKVMTKQDEEQRKMYVEMWIANRNAELARRKELKEKEREWQEQLKLQRQQQSEIEYELWLEKKRRLSLARKNEMQERMTKAEEDRRLRAEKSLKAYETWLSATKNKFKKENQQSPGMTQTNC